MITLPRFAALTAVSLLISIGITSVPTCPGLYPMCLKNYGAVGSKTWICCKEDQQCTDPLAGRNCCYDYYYQKYLCDNDPEQPAAYGYVITHEELLNGACVGGQGACF